jgi:hypothetical protein
VVPANGLLLPYTLTKTTAPSTASLGITFSARISHELGLRRNRDSKAEPTVLVPYSL